MGGKSLNEIKNEEKNINEQIFNEFFILRKSDQGTCPIYIFVNNNDNNNNNNNNSNSNNNNSNNNN